MFGKIFKIGRRLSQPGTMRIQRMSCSDTNGGDRSPLWHGEMMLAPTMLLASHLQVAKDILDVPMRSNLLSSRLTEELDRDVAVIKSVEEDIFVEHLRVYKDRLYNLLTNVFKAVIIIRARELVDSLRDPKEQIFKERLQRALDGNHDVIGNMRFLCLQEGFDFDQEMIQSPLHVYWLLAQRSHDLHSSETPSLIEKRPDFMIIKDHYVSVRDNLYSFNHLPMSIDDQGELDMLAMNYFGLHQEFSSYDNERIPKYLAMYTLLPIWDILFQTNVHLVHKGQEILDHRAQLAESHQKIFAAVLSGRG